MRSIRGHVLFCSNNATVRGLIEEIRYIYICFVSLLQPKTGHSYTKMVALNEQHVDLETLHRFLCCVFKSLAGICKEQDKAEVL